jgi:hypothetical protein
MITLIYPDNHNTQIDISSVYTYIRSDFVDILQNNNISGYVIGVKYKTGEIQVGITGRIKQRESCKHAAQREIFEETGIFVYKSWFSEHKSLSNRFCVIYDMNLHETALYVPPNDLYLYTHCRDTRNRVGCLVRSNNKDLLIKLVSRGDKQYMHNDSIIAVAVIPIEDLNKATVIP